MRKYKDTIELNGNLLTKPYIASLNKLEREILIVPLFNKLRELGWMYPEFDEKELMKSYKRLCDYSFDLSLTEVYGNTSLALDICKYFCRESFYSSTEKKGKTMREVFDDDELLKKVCWNRLGLSWYDSSEKEQSDTFNLTPKMLMYQGPRSMRLVPQISIFKPSIAKIVYMKYSKENDLVYDYSAGFGCRALGALSCNRRYVAVDPLTYKEVKEMGSFFKFNEDRFKVYEGKSEDFNLGANTIDFAFSSPPYYDQEVYSNDESQAYNKGEEYFYNIYWKNTVDNCYNMLKEGKYFGLNITDKYPKMVDIAKEKFGEVVDIFNIRLTKSHLNKKNALDATKYEPIYVFKK